MQEESMQQKVICSKLFDLIKGCGSGIAEGGFHTPNHRWVIASSLMQAYNIVKEEAFRTAAEKYLAEGIDCDEDGEFTERSAGIYNAVNDYSMILLAMETGREEYLQHVVRNLEMMFTYMEPDGSIFTMNSTRQDRDAGKCYPVPYYPIYLYMADKTGDGRYAAMTDRIMEQVCAGKCEAPDCLYLFMAKPELKARACLPAEVRGNYGKYYPKAGIARIGREGYTCTLLRDNSRFLFFNTAGIGCHVKMCASFFGKGQFKAERLEQQGDSYILESTAKGFYREPFGRFIADRDYWEVNTTRTLIKELELSATVTVTPVVDGLELHIVTRGCDRVPLKVEFCVTPGTIVSGSGFMMRSEAGRSITVTSGTVKVRSEKDEITIGPAFGSHLITENMRGSEAPDANCFRLYFTGYTNIDERLVLHCVNG
jgi:hypothetical protein